ENENSGWILSTSWTAQTPLSDGIWYWRVKARDNAGNEGAFSSPRSFRVDTLPPENVSLLEPDNEAIVNDNTPLLRWSGAVDNSLPVKYRAVVAHDLTFVDNVVSSGWVENENWEIPQGLLDNKYYWKVIARDNAGTLFETPPRWFIVENAPPFTPQLLRPTNGTWENDNTPLFEWENAWDISQPVEYFVYISTDNVFENIVVTSGWVENENWTLPEENSLSDNVKYYWRVQARDNTGKLSENSETWWFIVDVVVPPKVTLWSPSNGQVFEKLTITFTWESVADNSGITYLIEIDNEPSFSTPLVDSRYTTTSALPSYTFSKTGWYYWRVRAIDGANNIGEWSDNWVILIGRWTFVERWQGMTIISQPTGWGSIETWGTTLKAPSGWTMVESWQATAIGAVMWRVAESWSLNIGTRPYNWTKLEMWENVATLKGYPIPVWGFVENWRGISIISLPREFRFIETFHAQISAPAEIVDFLSTIEWPPVEWREIEKIHVVLRAREPLPGIPVTVGRVAPGATATADFSSFNIPVIKLEMTLKPSTPAAAIDSITLSAKVVDNISGLSPPPGEVYKFMEFGVGGVAPECIQDLRVQFRVEKSWLRGVDEKTLAIKRLAGDWRDVPFELVGAAQDYNVYEMVGDFHSTFVIVAQKKTLPLQGPPVIVIPTEETPPPSPLGLFVLLGIGGVAVGLMFYRSVTRIRIGGLEKEFEKLQKVPPARRVVPKGVRIVVPKVEKMQMKKIARAIWGPPVAPRIPPPEERLAPPELAAVETLEKFIAERRKASKRATEKIGLEEVRRRLSKKEIEVFKELEKFVGKRRKAMKRVGE
ncbi:MAG: PGF-pre-PGF domain-containing protein, partial [Candidatus Hadarchaeales archaeon]